jgi:ribonuclease HII
MAMIVGIDEVGRGCLAGNLYAAGVLIPETLSPIAGVTDSKKLTPFSRSQVYQVITNHPEIKYHIASRPVSLNLTLDLYECFKEIIQSFMAVSNDIAEIRIDGNALWHFENTPPVKYIVKGDLKDWRIGAASIIAKVTRDRYMQEQSFKYPKYGWERNVGYGTIEHIEAIQKFGMTPLHRVNFCKTALKNAERKQEQTVLDLFGV